MPSQYKFTFGPSQSMLDRAMLISRNKLPGGQCSFLVLSRSWQKAESGQLTSTALKTELLILYNHFPSAYMPLCQHPLCVFPLLLGYLDLLATAILIFSLQFIGSEEPPFYFAIEERSLFSFALPDILLFTSSLGWHCLCPHSH